MADEKDVSVGAEENTEEKTQENKSEETKQETESASSDNAPKEDKITNGDPLLLEKQIIRQVEYYFGDINLPRDKFLQEKIKVDDGWVPLEVMLNFQRLSSLTKDIPVIAAALEKSSLLEVSEDHTKIRRSPERPLPVWNEDRKKELMQRTLYLKGFPTEDTTLDKLLDYFAQQATVENVQMRNYKDRASNKICFKGSVFVTFPTKEQAEEFLNKDIKYEENDLIKKWQSVYVEDKRKEREELKAKRKGGAKEQESLPKGAILHLKGCTDAISREKIKEKLSEYDADVAFISYGKGDQEAWVRLQGENSTKPVLEKIGESTIEIGGIKIEIRALEGEEEEEFLKKTMEQIQKKRMHNIQIKRGGRKGFRGDRKRKAATAEDGPPPKVSVTSE